MRRQDFFAEGTSIQHRQGKGAKKGDHLTNKWAVEEHIGVCNREQRRLWLHIISCRDVPSSCAIMVLGRQDVRTKSDLVELKDRREHTVET